MVEEYGQLQPKRRIPWVALIGGLVLVILVSIVGLLTYRLMQQRAQKGSVPAVAVPSDLEKMTDDAADTSVSPNGDRVSDNEVHGGDIQAGDVQVLEKRLLSPKEKSERGFPEDVRAYTGIIDPKAPVAGAGMRVYIVDQPVAADSDGDSLDDREELKLGTDPNNPDTDGDGRTDWHEVMWNTDPLTPDEFEMTK